jgi:transcriptional regulator with GAF, ATPase, and Fis domain
MAHHPVDLLNWPRPQAAERSDRNGHDPVRPVGRAGLQHRATDLATRFATIDSSQLDPAIVDSLRDLAESLGVDVALLWHTAADGEGARHTWVAPPECDRAGLEHLAGLDGLGSTLEAGAVVWFDRADDLARDADREACRASGLRSAAIVPIALADGLGLRTALVVGALTRDCHWLPAIDHLRLVAGVFGQALARKASHAALQRALAEIHQLREDARDEDVQTRPAVKIFRTSRHIVSESPAVQRALAQVEQVAPTPSTVLLFGETGAGKEVFAEAIHELSARHHRQMVRVSCAAIPSALIESELFGRERGAYTGALSRQIGRFEAANQSTLFLDEIGELPAETQVKLLRVLQERVIERLGSTQTIKVDVRIIAATNRNLEKAVEDKAFREDLFYRLNVFPIVVPPLRERVEDIPNLVWEFVNEFSKSLGKPIDSIATESMRQLEAYAWPGNVRELRNVIERAVIIATGPRLTIPIPQAPVSRLPPSSMTLRTLEIEHIRATLESTNWRIRGHLGAAERLGLKPTTLETRMTKLGLVRPKKI